MSKKRIIKERIIKGLAAGILGIGLFFACPVCGQTSQIPDARSFYETYGKEAVFFPTDQKDGMICFGTSAGRGGADTTHFSTIGWRMSFADPDGKLLQEVWFELGGSYLEQIQQLQEEEVYYSLYGVSLRRLEERLSERTLAELREGSASMWMDACMVVNQPGLGLSGSMDDQGKLTGSVYTSYEGITGAVDWAESARASLRGYFHKQVRGLFCTLQLEGTEGIWSLTGAGRYLYGLTAEPGAELAPNYRWQGWQGSIEQEQMAFSLIMNQDMRLRAVARSDFPPEFKGQDRFYSLNRLRSGKDTLEQLLADYAFADREDGLLTTAGGAVRVEGEQEVLRRIEAGEEGDCVLMFEAADTDGNTAVGRATVHLVDTTAKTGPALTGQIRFISDKYFEKASGLAVPVSEGGLMENSIWLMDPGYRERLRQALRP